MLHAVLHGPCLKLSESRQEHTDWGGLYVAGPVPMDLGGIRTSSTYVLLSKVQTIVIF
jgi:uncharacterized membrane protein